MMFKEIIKYLISILILFLPLFNKANETMATVFMYHRFNEAKYPETNISSEIFEQQVRYLVEENFNVLPLNELVMFLKDKKKIPEKSVFITIDDAFRSFYEYGFPILKKFKLPFTIFVSSDFVSDKGESDFMSWDMLKEISQNEGLVLNHTTDHESLLKLEDGEIEMNLKKNQMIIDKRLGPQPKILSYPYGESSIRIENLVKQLGYEMAFSQYSSPISRNENIFRLPRFALNEEFGSLERFKLILKAKPLMVEDVSFKDSVLNADNLKFSFKTSTAPKDINCYVNNLASLKKENQGNVNHLIIKNLKLGTRYRINCTHISEKGNVFWFGKMFKRIN